MKLLVVCLVACGLIACGSSAPSAQSGKQSSSSQRKPAEKSPAERELDEILGWLNGAPLDEATYRERFTPAFVKSVPYSNIQEILRSLHGEHYVISHVENTSATSLQASLKRSTDVLTVTLTVTSAPVRVAGLLLSPGTRDPFDAPKNAAEAVERLKQQGSLSLLVASIGGGTCEPLLAVEPEHSRAIGSAFKLWVLAALEAKLQAGELHWTDPVRVQDRWDSLPSGKTQDDPEGTQLSLRELASRMIAISDNTAADHLIHLVGRVAVEQTLVDTGHAHPEANRPFLTTRELSILKFGENTALRDAYLAADEAGRRELLETRVAAEPLPSLDRVQEVESEGPVRIDEIEWFASPLDLCRVWLVLDAAADAREVLAQNPGVSAPKGRWRYVGYKGGSEPGVLAMSWAHEDEHEKYVTAGAVNNSHQPLDETNVILLLAAIRDLTPKL